MANSWSFLHDEIMSTNEIYEDSLSGITSATKEDWNDFWEGDGISLTGNPYYSSDTITFGDTFIQAAQPVPMDTIFGGAGQDTISFDLNLNIF